MAGRTNTTDKGDEADHVSKGEIVDQVVAGATDFAVAEPPVDREDTVVPNLTDWNSLQIQSHAPAESAQHIAITDETIQGGGDIGIFGIDWTLTLTEGSVISQNTNGIALSDDADGDNTVAYGSEFQSQDFEIIGW